MSSGADRRPADGRYRHGLWTVPTLEQLADALDSEYSRFFRPRNAGGKPELVLGAVRPAADEEEAPVLALVEAAAGSSSAAHAATAGVCGTVFLDNPSCPI